MPALGGLHIIVLTIWLNRWSYTIYIFKLESQAPHHPLPYNLYLYLKWPCHLFHFIFFHSECIRLLGAAEFQKAYEYLNRIRFGDEESILSEESIMDGLRGLVTKPRDCFLVDQLLFLEKQEEITRQSR